MRVYLASWFASKDDMKPRAEQLRSEGIEVTSRWLQEKIKPTTHLKDIGDEYLRETATIDIDDIIHANVVVLNVPSATDLKNSDMTIANWARGGRHFEAGFHYAMMVFFQYLPDFVKNRGHRQLILVGHKENVFHYLDEIGKNGLADGFALPTILIYETWEEALKYLIDNKDTNLYLSRYNLLNRVGD